jgi:uncharacterized protein YecE (DUF72 family)
MTGRVVVGTSSWSDPGFVAAWYPPKMPARERLAWYAKHFEAVELNSSFYALPSPDSARRWAEVTPQRFTFNVKLHRLLSRHAASVDSLPPDLRAGTQTNQKQNVILTPGLEAALADRLIEAVAPLEAASKLGVFILQLSPAFSPDRHNLSELDRLIGRFVRMPIAVELRHRGWVQEHTVAQTMEYFRARKAAFVCVDAPAGNHVPIMPPIDAVTLPQIAYIRAHGRNTEGYMSGKTVAERFGYVYSDNELDEIAQRADSLARDAEAVHVMFNNNRADDAPRAATRFKQIIGQSPQPAETQLRLED